MEQTRDRPEDVRSEFLRAQWQQAVETFRTQITLIVQWSTLMMIANVTFLGYGIANRLGGVLIAASLFPLTVLLILLKFESHARAVIYTAIQIERVLLPKSVDGLARSYLIVAAGERYARQVEHATELADVEGRLHALCGIPGNCLFGAKVVRYGLVVAAFAYISLGASLACTKSWGLL